MPERALALDEQQRRRARRPRAPAATAAPETKSAITWSTAIPQPAIAIPVCPVGTNADSQPAARGRPRRAPASPTSCRSRSPSRRCARRARPAARPAPLGVERPGGRGAQIAQLDARAPRPRRQLGVPPSSSCSPASTCIPARSPRAAPPSTPAAARRRTARRRSPGRSRRARPPRRPSPRSARRRAYGHDLVGRRPGVQSSPRRHTTSRVAVADDAVRGLGVRRRARQAVGEQRERARSRAAAPRRGPGASRQHEPPVLEARARRTARRDQQVAVEVDVVAQRARAAPPGAMPSSDSIMQPSMTPRPSARAAWTIRTASRMPPHLASLMLMPSA